MTISDCPGLKHTVRGGHGKEREKKLSLRGSYELLQEEVNKFIFSWFLLFFFFFKRWEKVSCHSCPKSQSTSPSMHACMRACTHTHTLFYYIIFYIMMLWNLDENPSGWEDFDVQTKNSRAPSSIWSIHPWGQHSSALIGPVPGTRQLVTSPKLTELLR